MNILFVCKYNRGRSQIAEAFFNKINTDKNIKATSAGIFQGFPIDPMVFACAKEFGIALNGNPKTMSVDLIRNQNLIIIVADDVPQFLFTEHIKFKRKTIVWKIPDIKEYNYEDMKSLFNAIQNKIKEFIEKREYVSTSIASNI